MDFDVAIVGAGAAGISATRYLIAKGLKTIILEASSRVGGRAWTIDIAGNPLDLGCGWLHSADRNPMVGYARENGFKVIESRTAWLDQWRDLGFKADDQLQAKRAWDALVERMHKAPPISDLAADALEPNGRWNAYCQSLSSYLNGASLERLSVEDFLAYDSSASDANWRIAEGYGKVIAASVPLTTLKLSCPVRRIAMRGDGVEIGTERGLLTARAAVVAVSTSIIASGAIEFDKHVDSHIEAAADLPLGLADKLFFELTGKHGLEPETHVLGNQNDSKTGSYYIRPLGRELIEGFFGGAGAVAIEEMGLRAAFSFAEEQLADRLGSKVRRHLRPILASCWSRMDWIGGSYSHALPGKASKRKTLAQSIEGRLFFAGEATHPTDFSTAHGAWESGIRAASEVAAMLAFDIAGR
ncbi:FAD-dependent oxidoreductase [Rhizobium leguminosarum]|uniref:flavin monoamine oxidase family protein n=1 Tax=Rhizobium leguminosarum TaxID=384 RepID=UPI001C98DCD2|nr:NAD(P)/FAD-dependent oxidoreductase [Rhizobium leguminosarum]MBY5538229.1 FAD-dependent oxidoreductase [Rhizobium leguminosarum]